MKSPLAGVRSRPGAGDNCAYIEFYAPGRRVAKPFLPATRPRSIRPGYSQDGRAEDWRFRATVSAEVATIPLATLCRIAEECITQYVDMHAYGRAEVSRATRARYVADDCGQLGLLDTVRRCQHSGRR